LTLTKTPKKLMPQRTTGATIKYTRPSNVFQFEAEDVQYCVKVAAARIWFEKTAA